VLQEDLPLRLVTRTFFLPLPRALFIIPFKTFELEECALCFFDMMIPLSFTATVDFFS
jgi:hypothetical protein